MSTIGTLVLEMSANVARLQSDMNRATGVVGKATKDMSKAFETVKTVVEAVFASAVLKSVIDAGEKVEQSANRLTAAYKLQGAQVGLTREQLDAMAESLASATQFDDKDFVKGEAELLKFGNIYGDVFTRALKLSADLAAFNGTDVATATDALGKALANPIQGVKGLGASVGKLLPAQSDMIRNLVESGQGLQAQNYILDLVQNKIGGTADLMNTGYIRAIEDSTKAWDKFKESLAGITVIKGAVTNTLEGIATTLNFFSGVAQGSAEPLFGKRIAMYKEMLNLQQQIAEVEKAGGHSDLTWTDDQGRVMGEDLHVEDLKKKLTALRTQYDEMFVMPPPKVPPPKLGPSPEQIAFTKQLERQTKDVQVQMDSMQQSGMVSPVAALFGTAAELHMGAETIATIKGIGGAIADLDLSKASSAFAQTQSQAISDLKSQEKLIGATADEQKKWTAQQQYDNEVKRISLTLMPEQAAQFEQLAAIISGDVAKAYDELFQKQHLFQSGMKQGLTDVFVAASDSAAQAHALVVDSFKSMEDALVSFVQTGKADWKSMADSIIAQIIRIRIEQSIVAPMAAALGSSALFGNALNFLTGGSSSGGSTAATFNDSMYIPARASGGPISAGMPYLVGENGPEIVVPRSGGTVIPNGAGGSVGVHIENLDMRGASVEAVAQLQRFVQSLNGSIENRAVNAVASARQRGAAGLR